jgi:hypothetical protein
MPVKINRRNIVSDFLNKGPNGLLNSSVFGKLQQKTEFARKIRSEKYWSNHEKCRGMISK